MATDIGQRSGNRTLISFALHCQGLGFLKQGHMARAWALLDESMIDAAAGRLHAVWAGRLHCGMIQLCEQLEDPRRGWQWIEATEQWLEGFPEAVLFPGVCRVHKARLMQQHGEWPDAEAEARRACDELREVHVYTTAQGYYERGEIKRLTGDYTAAEELFRQANQLGFNPQPGLARLRLAQGRTEAAIAGIRRALDETPDRLARGRLLPHHVDVSLGGGDFPTAAASADELDAIVKGLPDRRDDGACRRDSRRGPVRAARLRGGVTNAVTSCTAVDGDRLSLPGEPRPRSRRPHPSGARRR
jgi:tetratricopeptide (TPR) repeat protein